MPKDPICGMDISGSGAIKLSYGGKDYFFCGSHCKDKFLKQQGIKKEDACCVERQPAIFRNKLFILSVLSGLLLVGSLAFPVLAPFRIAYVGYIKSVWWAVALGLILGGIIDYYVPREYISKILSKKSPRTIFIAVLLGFLAGACSHGILALSIQIHKKGASNSAVVSFLLASPWANFAVSLMLISLFGLKGIFIIIAAILVAINTGFIFMFLDKRGLIEKNNNTVEVDEGFSIRKDLGERAKNYNLSLRTLLADFNGVLKGSAALSNMVLWWIILGLLIASFAGAYIPVHFFHKFMGPTFTGLLVVLVLASVIEVCSEGSSPLAFEIYNKTGALGNSFVFLMAGVATDYTEIGLLWANVGRRVAIWVPIICVPQIIIIGYIANIIFK